MSGTVCIIYGGWRESSVLGREPHKLVAEGREM